MQVQSFSGGRIRHCHKVQCRSDEARIQCCCDGGVDLSYSSDSTPSLGTSICHRCGCKKKTQKKKYKEIHGKSPQVPTFKGTPVIIVTVLSVCVCVCRPVRSNINELIVPVMVFMSTSLSLF